MSLLRFDGVGKRFPGVAALEDITFGVDGGSVHALCGENGAGKSTLLKILAGVHVADAGRLVLDGRPVRFRDPHAAIVGGIAVIHQELHLVPSLSVAENILLGHAPSRLGCVDRRGLRDRAMALLEETGVAIDPDVRVETLSIAQRQMVEIAKALSRDARVIAFDEPTSSLSAREVDALFRLIRRLRDQGKAVLYVSHRMDEIFALCDAATVLRDGRHVATHNSMERITPADLVREMVGRELEDIFGYVERPVGEVLLDHPGLSVRSGEIVGLFGLVGAGRTELLKEIYGEPRRSISRGIMLCPEDRKREGIIPMRSVAENINLSVRRRTARWGAWIDSRAEAENAAGKIAALRIRTPGPDQEIRLLSGGNQQKAILARWLSEKVRVLLLDEPTRGIDVGAKREIYDIVYDLARSGAGVVIASSELPEVLGVCDRILVLRQGKIAAEFARAEATPERCLEAALPRGEEPACAV
ncbi:MAG: ATP-binding cassette domain-containing protein [Armatimonadota bacterium]